MSRQANPTLIGAFVLGAILLGAVTVLLLAGGQWFQERRQHVLYFEGAAQGLQVGAPVVFLGVKVGKVKRIQLGLNAEDHHFVVPVTIEVEPNVLQSSRGEQVDLRDRKTIRQLVERGLRGRLKMQSLLTGQLYVDLDFYPDKPARYIAGDPHVSEIPTIPPTVKELAATLDRFPMDSFLADLAAISRSLDKILSSEAAGKIPVRLEATLGHLQSLSAKLDRDGGPMLTEMRADLVEMRRALEAVRAAMLKLGGIAEAGSPVVSSLGKVGEELAKAAQSLQGLAGEESPSVHHFNTALQEITRAARALRLLAETLEQQPEAVLQGKRLKEERK
ncbi:MAG: MlaD family protein [Desulfobulbaceae bacterium]|nr:MlaD family protein [Desulfobulbaceae bacterium]HIJ90647.1 MCE family protein [Deltaproteobacteria bacterium]